jgi:hypothetical protein
MTTMTRPATPRPGFPARVPGSVRRVMHLDYDWIDAVDVRVTGAARDEVKSSDRRVAVVDETAIEVETDGGTIARFDTDGTAFDASVFVGHPLRQGFRRRAREVYVDDGGTFGLLLDDISGAMVAAGYVHAMGWDEEPSPGAAPTGPPPGSKERQLLQADLCSGWRSDGAMMTMLRAGQPMQFNPVAPVASLPDGADGWPTRPIPTPGLRRHRRIDVAPVGEQWRVDAWFRDTYRNPAGEHGALHEYTVDMVVDARDHTVVDVRATPHALPWDECPAAADAVHHLLGMPVDDLRATVQKTIVGIECCTHLNNELRELADLPAMVQRASSL